MKSLAKRIAVFVIKFGLPVLILGWLVWRIDAAQWQALRSHDKSYPLLAGALVMAFAAVCLTFVRWAMLVRCHGIRLGMLDALRLGTIGFLLSFVSAGSVGGDLFKAVFLARRTPGKRLEAVASVFVDRALGLYGLVMVVVAVLVLAPPATASEDFQQLARGAAALAVLGTIALGVLVTGGKRIDLLLRRMGRRRWIGPIIHRVADPLRVFHTHPRELLMALLMSFAVHGLLATSLYLIARGLYADPPSLLEHWVIVPAAMLAAALPLTPAGLGVLELSMEWLYRVVPADPTQASGTLVALVFEIVRVVLAGLGVLFYWTSDREVRETLASRSGDGDLATLDEEISPRA